jgi:methionyl-tRNA formyltransferase
MKSPNIIILTGNDDRHKYFIHHLNANFSISEIYLEKGDYPSPKPQSEDESIAWDWFFQNRERHEKTLVRNSATLPAKNKPKKILLEENELNSFKIIDQIEKTNPGFIAVFGTGILSPSFLKRFPQCLYNLHIGDPQFYRGSSCSFWPIYKGELNHLSATIHRIDQNIDTGDILSKQAITMSKMDNEQTLLLKPLILGTELMIQTIKNWQSGSLHSTPQKTKGNLYKRSDFTPEVLFNFKEMIESGQLNNNIQAHLSNS